MSGVAEASLVLGLISSIISIVQATKVIYDGATDKSGLPKAFREVNGRLPLVLDILGEVKRQNDTSKKYSGDIPAVLKNCEDEAKDLRTIFDKVFRVDGASWQQKYLQAAHAVKPGRSRKVESLMGDILKNLQLLESHHLFTNVATSAQMEKLGQDLQAMLDIEKNDPSLPEEQGVTIYSSGQGSNINTSSGSQKIQQTFGTGTTINAENYYASKVDSLAPRSPTLHKKCILMPYETVKAYSPRPELSALLEEKLKLPYKGPRPSLAHAVVVTGLGGTGKTQLVLDFVESHMEDYDTVVWLNGSSEQNLRSSFAMCCEELYLKPAWSSSSATRIEDEPTVRAVLHWFRRRLQTQKWLVILDNADDATQCPYGVVPRGEAGSVIITSRDKRAARLVDERGTVIEVDVMDEEEAVPLLLSSAGLDPACSKDIQTTAKYIVDDLDKLPLAVNLAGMAISDELQLDDDAAAVLKRYLSDLRQHRDLLLRSADYSGLTSYDKTVWSVWNQSFAAIEKFHTVPALELLTFLTYADRSCIQSELFKLSALQYHTGSNGMEALLPGWLVAMLSSVRNGEWDDVQYRETIKPLLRYGLIRPVRGPAGTRGITLHGLVRWRASKQHNYEEYWKAYVAWTWLITRHCLSHPESALSQRSLIPHLPSTKKLSNEVSFLDATQLCHALSTFALVWRNARMWQRAERLVLKCFLTTKALDDLDSQLATRVYRHEIAEIQFHRKFRDEESVRGSDITRRTDAALLIEKIYESEKLELGQDNQMTLSTGVNLVGVFSRQDREESAQRLSALLLKSLQQKLGKRDPKTLLCKLHAISARRPEELVDAARLQREVLDTSMDAWGEEHPVTIAAMKHLAATYGRLESWQAAEATYQKLLDIQGAVLGEAHPDTIADIRRLASLYESSHRIEDANSLREKANSLEAELGELDDADEDGTILHLLGDGMLLKKEGELGPSTKQSEQDSVQSAEDQSKPAADKQQVFSRISGWLFGPRQQDSIESESSYRGSSWQDNDRVSGASNASDSNASELRKYGLDDLDTKPILVYEAGELKKSTNQRLTALLDRDDTLRVTRKTIPRGTSTMKIAANDLLHPWETEFSTPTPASDASRVSVKIPSLTYWTRLLFGTYDNLYIVTPERQPWTSCFPETPSPSSSPVRRDARRDASEASLTRLLQKEDEMQFTLRPRTPGDNFQLADDESDGDEAQSTKVSAERDSYLPSRGDHGGSER